MPLAAVVLVLTGGGRCRRRRCRGRCSGRRRRGRGRGLGKGGGRLYGAPTRVAGSARAGGGGVEALPGHALHPADRRRVFGPRKEAQGRRAEQRQGEEDGEDYRRRAAAPEPAPGELAPRAVRRRRGRRRCGRRLRVAGGRGRVRGFGRLADAGLERTGPRGGGRRGGAPADALDVVEYLRGAFGPVGGVLGEHLDDEGVDGLGEGGVEPAGRGQGFRDVLHADGHGVVRPVGDDAGEQLVEDYAKGVEVAAGGGRLAEGLLRGEVARRPEDRVRRRDRGRRGGPRDAEVRNLQVAHVRDEDVLGLDVPVYDAALVGRPQRLGHLAGDG